MKKYVRSFPERVGYSDETKSKYDKRLLAYATEGLKDLTLIAEKLPEKLQSKIFNEIYLKLFFRAIFNMGVYWQKRNEGLVETSYSKIMVTRIRMLNLCNFALSEIGQSRNAALLAPTTWDTIKQLPSSTYDTIYGTKAIQAIQIEGYLKKRSTEEIIEDFELKGLT